MKHFFSLILLPALGFAVGMGFAHNRALARIIIPISFPPTALAISIQPNRAAAENCF